MLSVILPAYNEAATIGDLIAAISEGFAEAEILVADDASEDGTAEVARDAGARVISHRYRQGNGAAVKTGARAAQGDILVFMDADGQHDPAYIPQLLAKMDEGYDMVVGARSGGSQASAGRWAANRLYNVLASWITNQRVMDLTSGFRAVRAHQFREFLALLPNGFSYPTSITMAFFRTGYPVGYVPIEAGRRSGKGHLSPLRDGVRFLLIIFKMAVLYSPMKIFVPVSASFFGAGIAYYLYTYLVFGRFTNMATLLLITAVLIFLIGLVSEQITMLLYRD